MGHTADEWAKRVLEKLNDTGWAEIDVDDVMSIGVVPALAQFSQDRPRSLAVDLTPAARLLPLPTALAGWVAGWSEITRIEAPAGWTPPRRVDPGEWVITRDPADPDVTVVQLPEELAVGDTARVFFTAPYPKPAATTAADVVPEPAFEAVTSLAASYVCTALATTAALGRQGSLPTAYVDGTERSRNLLDVAAQLRVLYNTYIGLGQVAGGGPSSPSAKALRVSRIT